MNFLFRQSLIQTKRNNKGFTLIEVLVAIFIGLIVMAMAVAILGVTNSVSLRVLSKSESQQNIRNSVVKLLDNLSNASSLETCRVATNANDQGNLSVNGSFSGSCKEYVKTGNIIAWAAPNKLCYFDKRVEVASINSFPDLNCISRGGPDAYNSGDGSNPLAGSSRNLSNCIDHQPGGSFQDADLIYLYSCSPNGGTRGAWAGSYATPTADNESLVADIGLDDGIDVPPPSPLPIFSYLLDDYSRLPNVVGEDLKRIVAVEVNFEARYRNYQIADVGRFRFNQIVILKESDKATEEEFNG